MRIGPIVGREAFAIATNRVRRSKGAACDLKANRTHRISTCVHIRDCIRNAVGTIASNEHASAGVIGKRNRRPSPEQAGIANRVALAFVTTEVENLVLNDRASGCSAELLQVSRIFRP